MKPLKVMYKCYKSDFSPKTHNMIGPLTANKRRLMRTANPNSMGFWSCFPRETHNSVHTDQAPKCNLHANRNRNLMSDVCLQRTKTIIKFRFEFVVLAPAVQRADNFTQLIICYPADKCY